MSQQYDHTSSTSTSFTQENNNTGGNASSFTTSSSSEVIESASSSASGGFDWLALAIVIIIAALFAIVGRLQPQPSTSLVPVAVLSASGCGLFITALRKLRTSKGVGLLEAALGGLVVAVFQFIAALSYPGVIASLGIVQFAGPGFFTTWGLVAFFSTLFSVAGAALGHLAFAPLRPLPASPKVTRVQEVEEDDIEASEEQEPGESSLPLEETRENQESLHGDAASAPRPIMSYVISIVMLGLAPILIGYVFAAAFDFSMSRFGYDPGPFPTLRLLSTLLPWQIPIPVTSTGASATATILTLLWRIPLFFGNPSLFDAQALEPLVFNAAGLALLLVTGLTPPPENGPGGMNWGRLLSFEALLGLLIVVPANLWILQGLQGVLQIQTTFLPIGTLHILNPLTFTLNLITGPLVCMAIGALFVRLRRQ